MANTAGGLIIIGMDEDDQARATDMPGVALSDAEHNRMSLIVAAQVAPVPVFDILPKEDPARPGTGLLPHRGTAQPVRAARGADQ
jgi:hypothetical protein